jgi:protein gp37
MENTAIEWATHTFNPWEGCQKVGPGCDHCYAETRNARYGKGVAGNWGPGAPRRRTSEANWKKPLKWDLEAAGTGVRPRVFCASLADVFDNAVDPAWREDLFKLIRSTPNLDWLLLTKRIGNVADMLPVDWADEPEGHWPNVWIGATIVDQKEANRDIPKLLAVPAAKRFLSMEPLLGPVDLTSISTFAYRKAELLNALTGVPRGMFGDYCAIRVPPLDWIIVGGESGPEARPTNPAWIKSLRDQCERFKTPFLFKQWGEWFEYGAIDADGHQNSRDMGEKVGVWHPWGDGEGFSVRIGKKQAGRKLDGIEHTEFPA